MLRFDKAIHLSPLLKFVLSVNRVIIYMDWIFTIFRIHKYSNFMELIILLYTFLVTSFFRYKEYMVWLISFSKFSDVSPACIFASAIGNP